MSYGKCPTCGGPGVNTEKRVNGNTTCLEGHKHPRSDFLATTKKIKIRANHRLHADWFDDLEPEAQKEYVENHPHSKHAEKYDNAKDEEPTDNGDLERIGHLKSQIKMLKEDIADMKAEGDDSSQEQKQLEELQEELTSLT